MAMKFRMPPNPLQGLRSQDLRALGIGLELAAVIGGGAWVGSWADGKWGTAPWLALAGTIFGLTGGCWHALKMVNDGKTPYIPGVTKKPDASLKETPGVSEDVGPDSLTESLKENDDNPAL